MRKIFSGLSTIVVFLFFVSCTESYTVGLLFVDDKDVSATVVGPSQIIDVLTQIRKSAQEHHESTASLVPRWVVRKIPKTLCMSDGNETVVLSTKDEKKIQQTVNSFSNRVDIIFDYTCENALRVLIPLYMQHNFSVVSPYASSYTQNLKASESLYAATHVFSTTISPDGQSHAMLNFLAEQSMKNIILIDDGLRYSRVHTDMLVSNSQNFGITVAFRGHILPHAHNIKSLANRITIQNNDALIYIGAQAGAEKLVKQLRIAGYTNPIMLPRIVGSKAFLSRIGSYTDELYFVDKYPLSDSTSFHVFRSWFESLYAPLHFTRAVAETYVALEVALAFARNDTHVADAKNFTEIKRGDIANNRISTLFGDVYFDAQNVMRGVYGIFVVKNGLFTRYDK